MTGYVCKRSMRLLHTVLRNKVGTHILSPSLLGRYTTRVPSAQDILLDSAKVTTPSD